MKKGGIGVFGFMVFIQSQRFSQKDFGMIPIRFGVKKVGAGL
jgi:hypothetical protein